MLNYCCFTIRCAEAITWENFFQTKRNPGSRKERFHLAGVRLSNVITGYNLWRVYNTARTELHLVQPGHVIIFLNEHFPLNIWHWTEAYLGPCQTFISVSHQSQIHQFVSRQFVFYQIHTSYVAIFDHH